MAIYKSQNNMLIYTFFVTVKKCNVLEGKVHPCTGSEALYRPYSP